jgi:trk system potassium uptake protein
MKIIIIGAGSVGFQLARQLITEKKDVILIESDAKKAKQASNLLDCLVVNKDGSDIRTLKEVGISKADFFVCVTNSDEVNILACNAVAQETSKPCKIARINNTKYLKHGNKNHAFPWIDFVVNPEEEVSSVITNTIVYGASNGVYMFKNHDVQTRNITVDNNSYLRGKSLKEIKTAIKEEFIVGSIFRDKNIIVPLGETCVKEGDQICIVASKERSDGILTKLGEEKKEFKKILIVGGGKIGAFVAEDLIKMERQIKILEKDYEKCKILSERFPEAIVINGDISDEGVFEEERLGTCDLIIMTTKSQELNILSAIYAKYQGLKHAIVLVTNTNYSTMAFDLGIDSTINLKKSSVNRILTFLRKGKIRNIHSIFDGNAEVMESAIDDNKNFCDRAVKDIKLPQDSIILAVNRDSKDYIPDGNFVIKANDHIITLAKRESVSKIEMLFAN